jgi:bifunctional pyridoxal-dependent enzyme with beta-cystathionase and maltose regulon repressor activities
VGACGTQGSVQDLERLAALAARYGVTVLADEIHVPAVDRMASAIDVAAR